MRYGVLPLDWSGPEPTSRSSAARGPWGQTHTVTSLGRREKYVFFILGMTVLDTEPLY